MPHNTDRLTLSTAGFVAALAIAMAFVGAMDLVLWACRKVARK